MRNLLLAILLMLITIPLMAKEKPIPTTETERFTIQYVSISGDICLLTVKEEKADSEGIIYSVEGLAGGCIGQKTNTGTAGYFDQAHKRFYLDAGISNRGKQQWWAFNVVAQSREALDEPPPVDNFLLQSVYISGDTCSLAAQRISDGIIFHTESPSVVCGGIRSNMRIFGYIDTDAYQHKYIYFTSGVRDGKQQWHWASFMVHSQSQ
jgi:hypothetical protein